MGVQEQELGTRSSVTTLCQLAEKYGTDKWPWYTPFYDLLFRGRRTEVLRVLEVGIGTPKTMTHVDAYAPGASLRMWRDYFPRAIIYGADVDREVVNDVISTRIITVHCDQRSEDSLDSLLPELNGQFQLIIDDGSHDIQDQGRTYTHLNRLLAPGGIYIIEDANVEICGLPVASQVVECRAPNWPTPDTVGRCVVIQSS